MSEKLYFRHNFATTVVSKKRVPLSFIRVTTDSFTQHKYLIEQSIKLLNSEMSWDDMWDIDAAEARLERGETLYLLCENENPLGHVWYDLYYLYNAYVSTKRQDGDSVWFIQETMWDMKSEYDLTYIKLYVDDWNDRAKKFWKKLGYLLLT
tara:strand:- start:184 stop:636 length:453 start_codon:yes stop_codon:yes gene_type:complete